MITIRWQTGVMSKWSQMLWVVEAASCTFNHHQVKFAFVTNFVVIGVSSVPGDLAPAAQ